MLWKLGSALLISINVYADVKNHILYLMHQKNIPQAINAYIGYREKEGRDDYETLEAMCLSLIEVGLKSPTQEEALIALYGTSLCGYSHIIPLCELGLESLDPIVELAAVGFLGNHPDDRALTALLKAFNSPYLPVRIDAAYYLAMRKHPKVVGYIEAIRQKLPPQYHYIFPDILAIAGDKEAIHLLKKLMSHSELPTRIMALHAAAKFHREDLAANLRAAVTHPSVAEQEVAILSLATLRDLQAMTLAKPLLKSPSESVRIAAALALTLLGSEEAFEIIAELAMQKNLFALPALGQIEKGKKNLALLLKDKNVDIRFNAALALLHMKDASALPVLYELAFDREDGAFEPKFSMGRTQMIWHLIPSIGGYPKEQEEALTALADQLKGQILIEALELGEQDFLTLVDKITTHQKRTLYPFLIELLVNKKSLTALKSFTQKTGEPLLRLWSTLALYRLEKNPQDQKTLIDWLKSHQQTEIIRFRPVTSKADALFPSPFTLSPEETSALFLAIGSALADSGGETVLDTLLFLLRDTNQKNCYLIAGLILKAIQ